ncbi:MAG TPA: pitrilysin family protein [Polyangia bacterium]|nr:pitrilysin family protein [Polyangia bacterium]
MRLPAPLCASLLAIAAATATAPAAHAAPTKVVTVDGITEYALPNGLRVLLFPDASKPTLTVNVTYFVGSRHEGYGETGMAHLLEHLMFKGTPKRPKMLAQLEQRGAKMNGTTWTDRTNYFEILTATGDNLKFALELEADRMVNSKIAADDLKSEFSVVRNEFEMGENSPENILEERMLESAYLWHNYGKPTIGSRSDIERVPIANLKAFYQRFYQPDNAMLVVSGKIDPAATLKLIEQTFGKLPRPKRALAPTFTVEPVQDGERVVTLRRSGDVQIAGLMYHGVAGADEDYVAEQALVDVLINQPSGRLYKALVDTGLAAKVRGDAYPWAEPGVLQVYADVRADKPLDVVRDKMVQIVESLGSAKIGEDEVNRYKSRALREIELGLTDPERIGVELSEWAAMGDWRLKFIFRDRVKALTAERVQKLAAAYLKPSNRTVGTFVPTKTIDRSPLAPTPDVKALVASYKGQEKVAEGEAFVASIDNIEKRTERVTFANGFKLALVPKKTRGGSVEVLLHLRTGSADELKGREGVSELMQDLVMRGTRKRTHQQIRDELDRLKVELKQDPRGQMGNPPGEATFRLATVRESVPQLVALLGEIVREPALAKSELEALKKEKLAQLEAELSQPLPMAITELVRRAQPWPADDVRYHPTLAERVERIKAVTAEQAAAFHQQFWGGAGGALVLVGDFDAAQVKTLAEKELGAWKAPKAYQRIARPYRAAPPADETLQTPDKQMAFVGAALPFELRDDDPEFPALELGDFIFGGGARSRLWDRLREKDGLSYGAFSFVTADAFERNGLFFAGAICAPENARKAMGGLLEELAKLVDKGLRAGELAEMKKAFQARFDTELASDESVAALLDETMFQNRTLAFFQSRNSKIQTLSSTQVLDALKKHVRPDGLIKVNAGDLKP